MWKHWRNSHINRRKVTKNNRYFETARSKFSLRNGRFVEYVIRRVNDAASRINILCSMLFFSKSSYQICTTIPRRVLRILQMFSILAVSLLQRQNIFWIEVFRLYPLLGISQIHTYTGIDNTNTRHRMWIYRLRYTLRCGVLFICV